MPSSDTRFNTPFDPTMAVFTAPASITRPTITTNPENQPQHWIGPSRFMASPLIRFSEILFRTASGIIITAKNATPRRENEAVSKNHQAGFFQIRQLGMLDFAVHLRQVSSPLMASTEWPNPIKMP